MMAGMVILGALAAFGALCALWLLVLAWPGGEGSGVMVCCWRESGRGRDFVIRWRLLWDLGLVRCRLVVVDLGMTQADKAFLARWGRNAEVWEREDGEGTGDHPGRYRRRGLSEL